MLRFKGVDQCSPSPACRRALRSKQEQVLIDHADCLNLAANAVILENTIYMASTVAQRNKERYPVQRQPSHARAMCISNSTDIFTSFSRKSNNGRGIQFAPAKRALALSAKERSIIGGGSAG